MWSFLTQAKILIWNAHTIACSTMCVLCVGRLGKAPAISLLLSGNGDTTEEENLISQISCSFLWKKHTLEGP